MQANINNLKCLNLGCGKRFLPGWTNVDFVSSSEEVAVFNLLKGLPFPSNSFDVVYHSHLLEHFTKDDGLKFIKECNRVLKVGGTIRIAVPDLEKIAEEYLLSLKKVVNDSSDINKANYEWALLELYDQVIRKESGGEMMKYWNRPKIINEDKLKERVGDEFTQYRQRLLRSDDNWNKENGGTKGVKKINFLSRIKELILNLILKEDYQTLQLVNFTRSGELHQWMYDRYSLNKILSESAFRNIEIKNAFNSNIPGWERYSYLDTELGKVRKPDSIFVEAVK